MSATKPINIVLVEDDKGHARLIQKNLRRAGLNNEIIHFEHGGPALEFLSTDNIRPHLVVTDLNMPEVDGYELIESLRANERTKNFPVIVLTTTDQPYEIDRCYRLGCNVFVSKPVNYDDFKEAVRKLGLLFTVVQLPTPA